MSRKLSILILVLIVLVILSSCSLDQGANSMDSTREYEQLSDRLQAQIDRSQDDYLSAESDKTLDELIRLNSIIYGSFTSTGASEILAIFKVKNTPHAFGFDRTIAVIYDTDTYKLKSQKTFVADNVFIQLLENADQRHNILYIGIVSNQGYTTYDIELLQVEANEWLSKEISHEKFADTDAFSFSDHVLQVFELSYSNYNPVYNHKYSLYWDGLETIFKKELP
ncbi:hypothetical protein [Caldalkalibacillus mannanilyticus]|uniref:hypothetical protein n=1 Tax=Caldalkalibacillus mannanilyticus TaxID=1418 RepID=UPI00046A748C|nr:hypothetical protein [Caldalkalibacillus mannanilyticus]